PSEGSMSRSIHCLSCAQLFPEYFEASSWIDISCRVNEHRRWVYGDVPAFQCVSGTVQENGKWQRHSLPCAFLKRPQVGTKIRHGVNIARMECQNFEFIPLISIRFVKGDRLWQAFTDAWKAPPAPEIDQHPLSL